MTADPLTPAPAGLEPPPVVFQQQLRPILLLSLLFFFSFMARIVAAPLAPAIEGELGLTHAESGSLFLFISASYIISLLGSGFIAARITHKRTLLLSTIALGCTLLATSQSRSLGEMRMGFLMMGLAAGLYLPSAIASLTDLVDPRHWGKAIAIHELAPNLSFVVTPLLAEVVLRWSSWRSVYVLLGSAALVTGTCYARWGRGGQFCGKPPDFEAVRTLFKVPSYWMIVALFSLGISSSLGIFTMLPLYLITEHGLDQSWANTLISISRVSGLGLALLGGWASDRFGPQKTLRAIFFLTGALTISLAMVPTVLIPTAVILQPMLAVCFFPAGFAALALIAPPGVRHIAVAFTAPLAVLIGGGIVPAIIGAIGDLHSFAWGIALIGFLIATGGIIAGHLKFYSSVDD